MCEIGAMRQIVKAKFLAERIPRDILDLKICSKYGVPREKRKTSVPINFKPRSAA